jgi:glycine cleavage system H protein
MNIPKNLLYAKTHEWLRKNNDGTATIGISDYAQHALSDIVFAECKNVNSKLKKGEVFCDLESVKAAEVAYIPVSGTIIAINEKIVDNYEIINKSPYDDGWLAKIKIDNANDLKELLNPAQYEKLVEEEQAKAKH